MSHKNRHHHALPAPDLPHEKPKLIAKRDFTICQNEHFIEIKAGDDISSVPEKFIENLKTEKVI